MTAATQETIKTTTNINFLGLDGNPIVGLKVRLTVDGQEQSQTTDGEGCIPPLQVEPGTQVEIDVQRMDGSYKRLDMDRTGSSDSVWTLSSPSLVLDASTELHQGMPGDALSLIPIWSKADFGVLEYVEPPVSDDYREEGRNHPVVKQSKARQVKQANTNQLPDPSRASPPKTGAKAPLQSARDTKGNPLLVYVEKVKDWWGRWSFPWMHVEHSKTSNAARVSYSGEMEKKVKALIEFAEEQTTYSYSSKEGTAAIYAQMRNGTFKHEAGERPVPKTGPGRCYQWVRLALARAGVTDGYLADERTASYAEQESASLAESPLLRKGFKDVTGELPDARWAAAGDVIVYRWTDRTWEKRKENDSNKPNHGHIDIRSYETYISDFVPAAKHPNWADYTNIRIYRKEFDPLPIARMRAFLHCLRDYETQEEPDDTKRYDILNSALPSNPNSRRFGGFKSHPWQGVAVPDAFKKGKGSTAAGAYQITRGTWEEMVNVGWPNPAAEKELFSPALQDRIAIIILESTNGALSLLRTGKIDAAVNALAGRWSSLPGAVENIGRKTADGKPMDMAYFMNLFNTYLAQEITKVGIK